MVHLGHGILFLPNQMVESLWQKVCMSLFSTSVSSGENGQGRDDRQGKTFGGHTQPMAVLHAC